MLGALGRGVWGGHRRSGTERPRRRPATRLELPESEGAHDQDDEGDDPDARDGEQLHHPANDDGDDEVDGCEDRIREDHQERSGKQEDADPVRDRVRQEPAAAERLRAHRFPPQRPEEGEEQGGGRNEDDRCDDPEREDEGDRPQGRWQGGLVAHGREEEHINADDKDPENPVYHYEGCCGGSLRARAVRHGAGLPRGPVPPGQAPGAGAVHEESRAEQERRDEDRDDRADEREEGHQHGPRGGVHARQANGEDDNEADDHENAVDEPGARARSDQRAAQLPPISPAGEVCVRTLGRATLDLHFPASRAKPLAFRSIMIFVRQASGDPEYSGIFIMAPRLGARAAAVA